MALHWVRIIESGHFHTRRLFELGLSFGACKRHGLWPSLETMNSFLSIGKDDGALATDIEWEPCSLSRQEYELAVMEVMEGQPFEFDSETVSWYVWFKKVSTHDAV